MYGTFFINAFGINVLRGTLRNYAELYSFFELGGSLCFAQATERGGTSHLAVDIEPGQGHYPT